MNRYFDNGPIARMIEQVDAELRKISWMGCEIHSVSVDSFGALVRVSQSDIFPEQLEESGFGVFQKGVIKIVWKKSEKAAVPE